MNDSMTSVADIPGDADDDLSGISPELVLVDPELARLVREREPALLPAPPTLRLIPAKVPEPEPPVVSEPEAPLPAAVSEPPSPAIAAPSEPAPAAASRRRPRSRRRRSRLAEP